MYIKPKSTIKKKSVPMKANISHEAEIVFKAYSTYTEYTMDELLNKIAEQLLEDPAFIKGVQNQRYNKKILKVIEEYHQNKLDEDAMF
jgi:hypothetical protein